MMPSKPQLKFIRSLHQKKFREQENCFIAEGAKAVEELLQSDFTVKNIYAVSDFARQLIAQHKKLKEKTVTVTEEELKKISALTTPNKVLAVAEIPAKEIKFSSVSNSLSLALDNVSDPGN
ncbi:MAG: RNA methyltransferase, partial [Bacteroidia bacterium]|nr:RNA methyltransferase [Bacteroidia bacterium]